MRRILLTLAVVAAVVVTAGCGASNTNLGGDGGDGGRGGLGGNGGDGGAGGLGAGAGKATAKVTFDSKTYSLSGGTCTDIGSVLGTEVTAGNYSNGEAGPGDYLEMMVKGDTVSVVQGRAGGVPWALATGKQRGSISGGNGTFSGTDFASGKEVSGTFACN